MEGLSRRGFGAFVGHQRFGDRENTPWEQRDFSAEACLASYVEGGVDMQIDWHLPRRLMKDEDKDL